jgi:diguanylate cyclase (GGDEF)-like protein
MQAATAAGRPDLVCASWVETAREHAREEEGAQAQRAVDKVLGLVPELTSPQNLEIAYSGLTAVYSELGLTSLAVSSGRHALEHAELSGDVARVSMARTNFLIIGCVACEQALEPDPAGVQRLLAELRPQLEQLRQELPEIDSPLANARLLRVMGSMAACEERWHDAQLAYVTLTSPEYELPPHLACSAWLELGLVQRRLGLHDKAHESGLRAQAINPAPDSPHRWVDLRRLSLIKDLTGHPEEALVLLRRSQDRRHHIVMAALESRAATLSARLDEQTLRVENEGLRRSNASLRASVADIAQLANTDPLTALLNRRGLESAWGEIESQCEGRRVLGMVDVDHFKRVNDGHSHIVGDAVLREVARLMGLELRGSDRLARFGGEEFAALLVGVDAQAARSVFERLRRVIQDFDWERLAPGLRVTVSVGVVMVRTGEPFDLAAGRADRLLYVAKSAGRNRVVDALDEP